MTWLDVTQLKQVTLDVRVADLEPPATQPADKPPKPQIVRIPPLVVNVAAPAPASTTRPNANTAGFQVEQSLYLIEYRWADPPLNQSYLYEVARGGDGMVYILQQVPLVVCKNREKEAALAEALAWAGGRVREQVNEYVSTAGGQTGPRRSKGK